MGDLHLLGLAAVGASLVLLVDWLIAKRRESQARSRRVRERYLALRKDW